MNLVPGKRPAIDHIILVAKWCNKTEVDIDVEKIIGHPEYEVSPLGVSNDILLLKLKRCFQIDTESKVMNSNPKY